MKQLEVRLSIRNNRLKERRLALGLTQAELAKAAGISLPEYSALECLRAKPWKRKRVGARATRRVIEDIGVWSDDALLLSRFHGVEPEELFPESITNALISEDRVAKVDVEELERFIRDQDRDRLALPSPEKTIAEAEQSAAIRAALQTLTPREQRAIALYYGLADEDGDTSTIEGIGKILGKETPGRGGRALSRERVRQIIMKALSELRHTLRTKLINRD